MLGSYQILSVNKENTYYFTFRSNAMEIEVSQAIMSVINNQLNQRWFDELCKR